MSLSPIVIVRLGLDEDIHQRSGMTKVIFSRKRFRQEVRRVIGRLYVLNSDFAERDKFADLEVATINVTRAIARATIGSERDGPLIVDVEHRGLDLR